MYFNLVNFLLRLFVWPFAILRERVRRGGKLEPSWAIDRDLPPSIRLLLRLLFMETFCWRQIRENFGFKPIVQCGQLKERPISKLKHCPPGSNLIDPALRS